MSEEEKSGDSLQYPTGRQFLTIGFGDYYDKSGDLPDLAVVAEENKKFESIFKDFKFDNVERFPRAAKMHTSLKAVQTKIKAMLDNNTSFPGMLTVNVIVFNGHGFRHVNGDPIFVIPDLKGDTLEFLNAMDLAHEMASHRNTLNLLILNFCNNDLPLAV